MSRRTASTCILIAMFGLCFAVLGRTPRMPEMRGQATLEMSLREGLGRTHGLA